MFRPRFSLYIQIHSITVKRNSTAIKLTHIDFYIGYRYTRSTICTLYTVQITHMDKEPSRLGIRTFRNKAIRIKEITQHKILTIEIFLNNSKQAIH